MNFPKAFKDRIHQQLGKQTDAFFNALTDEAPVSVRLNPVKENIISGSSILWCSTGLYLEKRPSFTLDPLFQAGCYYVQESASMFLEEIFRQLNLNEKKLLVLDACAAPGGKSTHLASLVSNNSLVVSNEVIASRISVLKENIIKWGTGNVVVTNNDPSSFSKMNGLFDVIVVDAPCSGEGLFRKDIEALNEWSENACSLCANRQQRILNDLLPSLKTDGLLIYSTCTYNSAENEDNIKWLIDEHDMECIPLNIPSEWGIAEMISKNFAAYSFYPHRVRSEGFFISVLKKKKQEEPLNIRTQSKKLQPLNQKFPSLNDWLTDKENLYINQDEIYLISSEWINHVEFFLRNLKVKYAGTPVATIKKEHLIPTHPLALSVHLNKANCPSLSLTHEEALKYLRKEDFKKEVPEKGWLLAKYGGTPLGWVKALEKRLNNYYPVEWRIRMK